MEDSIPISNMRYSTCSSFVQQLLMASSKSFVVKPFFTWESSKVRRRLVRSVERKEAGGEEGEWD